MRRTQNGFQLVELLVAVALVAVPLMAVIGLVRQNINASKLNVNHLALELLVTDLAEQVCCDEADRLATVTEEEGNSLVLSLLNQRLASLPEQSRQVCGSSAERLVKSVKLTVDKDVGGHPRLFKVVLTAMTSFGGSIKVFRFVRLLPAQPTGPEDIQSGYERIASSFP